ncbi:MAG: hypothetical protein ACI91G_000856, partial [Gammaproteobacteria bacterium]
QKRLFEGLLKKRLNLNWCCCLAFKLKPLKSA